MATTTKTRSELLNEARGLRTQGCMAYSVNLPKQGDALFRRADRLTRKAEALR